MTAISPVRPPDGPSDTDVTHPPAYLGRRALTLTPGHKRIDLAEGLSVSWKAKDIVAGPDAVEAAPVTRDGRTGVRLSLPADPGWVRLNCALDRPPEAPGTAPHPVLGCRMMVCLPPGAEPLELAPALAWVQRASGRSDTAPATGRTLTVAGDGWHLIEALFLCAPDTPDRYATLVVRLPEARELLVGPVETDWFPAEVPPDLAARIGADPAIALRPFGLRAIADDPAGLAAPYAAAARIEDGALTGWVLGGTATAVQVHVETQTHRLPLDQIAEPWPQDFPGLRMPCGFKAPLAALCAATPGATRLTCRLDGDPAQPAAFADIALPQTHGPAAGPDNPAPPQPAAAEPPPAPEPAAPAPIDGPTLFHSPPDSGPDPYRQLLYRALPDLTALPGDLEAAIGQIAALRATAAGDDIPAVVLHLHGLADVLGQILTRATDPASAAALQTAYLDRMRYFVHLGGIVVWTLDGVLPEHKPPSLPDDVDFDAAWLALGQAVIDLARIVHVHSVSARDRARRLFRIPDARILVGAHPSYIGHYPDYVTRADAHARLGLTPDTPEDPVGPVFLLHGQLYPGKGVKDLVSAFVELRKSVPQAWLIVLGEPVAPLRKGDLTRSYGALPNVKVIETQVSDTTLQWYFRAADWAVQPYRDVITPKSLICDMSFGLPVIAPGLPPVAELLHHGVTGLLYDAPPPGGDPVPALTRAMASAATRSRAETEAMGEAARTAIGARSRPQLADALSTAIRAAWARTPVEIAFDDRPRTAHLLGRTFPPAAPARTAAIILNYGNADDSRRLIRALRAGTDRDLDIYLVDNCSPNLSVHDLATLFDDVHVLRLPENLGYAAGNNAVLRLIDPLPYDFVWILNPDMAAPPTALAQLIAAAEAHPETDIFGPVLLRGDAERRVASAGCYVSLEDGLQTGHLYAGELVTALPTAPYEADFITGAALFLRRRALDRIGTLPEDYFLYFEETEWLTEARAKGRTALVLPQIELAHHKRSEEGDLPAPYFYYYYIRNALIFAARSRSGSPQAQAATAARLRAEFVAAWLHRIGTSRPDRLPVYKALGDAALADGLAGRTGPVDLVALELAALDLPDPAAPAPTAAPSPTAAPAPNAAPAPDPAETASCTARIGPDDTLTGQVALSRDADARAPLRLPVVTVLLDGRIIGHARAEPLRARRLPRRAASASLRAADPCPPARRARAPARPLSRWSSGGRSTGPPRVPAPAAAGSHGRPCRAGAPRLHRMAP